MDNEPAEDKVNAARSVLAAEQAARLTRAQERINQILSEERVRLIAEPVFTHTPGGGWATNALVRLVPVGARDGELS